MERLVEVKPNGFNWFADIKGAHLSVITEDAYKSLARYARQNYECDIIPVVTEYVILENETEWGDVVVATVQYSSKGYVSSAGGQLVDRHIKWSCYAD